MKKLSYLVTALVLCISFSCQGFNLGGDKPQPCINTTTPLTIQLNFSGASYLCTQGVFSTSAFPPTATIYNYLTQASATGTAGSLSNSYAYLCQITSKNDQQASAYCTDPGLGTFTWSKANSGGVLSNVAYSFIYEDTDVTVDYYDICAPCTAAIPEGRPYFSGVTTLPGGANQSIAVQMFTQSVYTSPNCQ